MDIVVDTNASQSLSTCSYQWSPIDCICPEFCRHVTLRVRYPCPEGVAHPLHDLSTYACFDTEEFARGIPRSMISSLTEWSVTITLPIPFALNDCRGARPTRFLGYLGEQHGRLRLQEITSGGCWPSDSEAILNRVNSIPHGRSS